ncbi:MAG TPA: group 1 truncated hemoglobin [Terriglobia bacterium]|nr:group 1 truncated hemoglobin [Terriglobia bacterium]
MSKLEFGMILAALLAVMLVPTGRTLAQILPAKESADSLYHRMGGYDVIAEIVGDFIQQLGTDKAFERFGGGRSQNSLVRTKQLVIDQICNLAGGPCAYIGRDTKTAHAGLAITNAEWDSSIQKFKNSLNKYKIKEREQKDFIAMIEKLKPDVVEKPKAYKATGATPKAKN